jgi:foldase protein PrsA
MRTAAATLLVILAACDAASAPPPAPPPKKEPDRITVRHILVSFAGTRTKATRTKEEAAALATQLLDRVKAGEDFASLMKRYSDDTGPGIYTMVNDGQTPSPPQVFGRRKMVPAFGNVGFSLEVNGIGMSTYDPKESPFGWHIIQRTE